MVQHEVAVLLLNFKIFAAVIYYVSGALEGFISPMLDIHVGESITEIHHSISLKYKDCSFSIEVPSFWHYGHF